MSDIRDIHDTLHIISDVTKRLLEHILHNITAQIADMCEVIHRRSAGVHCNLAILVRDHRLNLTTQCVIKTKLVFHLNFLISVNLL